MSLTGKLQEHINFIEKEMVETKLGLAITKGLEDELKLKLARMSSFLNEVTLRDNHNGNFHPQPMLEPI